jgi:hypothetical protein
MVWADIVKVSQLWESDGGAVAWQTNAVGNLSGNQTLDIFPDADPYGVFSRITNYGYTPLEHFRSGADDIAWTGFAAYTGYATPNTLTYAPLSHLNITDTGGAVKYFRYRSYLNQETTIGCREFAAFYAGTSYHGIMVDDGVNNADGNGADNFCRILSGRSGVTVGPTIYFQYRSGGGAVTTVTGPVLSPNAEFALVLQYGIGTRWSSWQTNFYILSEAGLDILGSVGSLTWTPARHGLWGITGGAYSSGVFDWFTEI